MAHIHSVYDTDLHFSINPRTRTVMNESTVKTVLIQGDHNSERCTFELPRTIDGHDMLKCNVVQVHFNNVDAVSKASSRDVYEVDDLQVSPKDDNVVICSWLISNNATRYAGALGFVLRFACSSTGKIDYAWHTAVCSAISVSTGLDNTGLVVEEYSDVLEQWREELFGGQTETAGLIVRSSTPGSSKKWLLTVDDSGTIKVQAFGGDDPEPDDPEPTAAAICGQALCGQVLCGGV